MMHSLFDSSGTRKYLVRKERHAFIAAAIQEPDELASFCLTLAITGARISEVLAVTGNCVDRANQAIVFRTLKQRNTTTFRAVPVPTYLLNAIERPGGSNDKRLWAWGRTTAWKSVKVVMEKAGIDAPLCKPKALRHAFAIEAGQQGIPLNIVQRWLGHARIETTAIYAGAIGEEERLLAKRAWKALEPLFRNLRTSRLASADWNMETTLD